MKTKYILLIGLLAILAVVLTGCATGLTATSWPGVTADANYAYIAGGPYVYAVNLQTGVQAWRFPDKASAANPFYATPALTSTGQLIVGGFDKKLYSLDPKTGKSTWTFADAHDRYIGGALITDDMVFAPNADYKLYALNLQGQLKWSFEADQSIWGKPASDGTNVYFGTLGKKVYAVSIKTGKQVWVQTLDGAVLGSPVLGGDTSLFVGTYGGTLYALSTASGKTNWSKPASSWIWSGPALDGSTLYVADANGKLLAYTASAGDKLWEQDLNGAILGTPLVTADFIVVGTEKGTVYYIDRTGKVAQTIAIPGTVKVYTTAATAGTLILVAPTGVATDPILYALDQAGVTKWPFTPPK
jgi:eukaryotic-like serine/threonine-protein kinase